MVKRVRGVAYSMRVSPQNTNRMVDGARGVLNQASSQQVLDAAAAMTLPAGAPYL
jgi:hypothetical protein